MPLVSVVEFPHLGSGQESNGWCSLAWENAETLSLPLVLLSISWVCLLTQSPANDPKDFQLLQLNPVPLLYLYRGGCPHISPHHVKLS